MSAQRRQPSKAEREVTVGARRIMVALTFFVACVAAHQQVTLGSVQTETWGVIGLIVSFWIGQAGDGAKKWSR